MHGLADEILAEHRTESSTTVAPAGVGRGARSLELDVEPRAGRGESLSEQDGPPVTESGQVAELVTGVRLRDGLGARWKCVAGEERRSPGLRKPARSSPRPVARARLKRTRWGWDTGVGWTRLKNADGRRAYELSNRQPPSRPEGESGAGTEDMALEGSERDEVEDAFVAGFQDDRRSAAGLVGFHPTQGAQAPSVAGLEPWGNAMGLGVERSFPASRLKVRNSAVTCAQTT